jgi:multiple sugar transport system ATP-binding protein
MGFGWNMAKIQLERVNYTVQNSSEFLIKTLNKIFKTPALSSPNNLLPKEGGGFSLREINLTIPDGKTLAILGPSGCGKTTLLRLIAGLLSPDSGQIRYDDVDMVEVKPQERKIGMVFQNYALYPHFRSEENILSYFLFRKKTPELDQLAREKYQQTSELMGVDFQDLIGRMPTNLSGGERQRVALGRCITRDPDVFLLDEPFSNLDLKLREKYRVNLKKLLRHFKITTVYVTHDQHEAVLLGDIIGIMDQGRIVQVGVYEEIYSKPKNLFTAEFLNLEYETRALNLIPGEDLAAAYTGQLIGFRPEDVTVAGGGEGQLRGRVIDSTEYALKKLVVLTVQLAHSDLQLYSEGPIPEGAEVALRINRLHVFGRETGERIESVENAALVS